MADHVITTASPESGGAYTSVGTYDAGELVAMVVALGAHCGTPAPEVTKSFGVHLFNHFVESHADTLGNVKMTVELLGQVENRIHVEVRKLFPDAELPTIRFTRIDESTAEVIYQSTSPFANLAEGLIASAIAHFGDPIELDREYLAPEDGTHAKFVLVRTG